MKSIGEKIKECRRQNEMTQEKLADYLGVTYQTVSKWETGVTSPDLSLIVPIARLFRITTDELFDFNESVENIQRAEFMQRYDATFKTGDITVRLSVAEEAVKAYPGDMDWLNKYAWAIWGNAVSISDNAAFNSEREKATALFEKVIYNCEDDEIKCHAIAGIVQCLNSKGNHAEAKRYAELYPDIKISADTKEELLISCLTGEERIVKQQERLLKQSERLIESIIGSGVTAEEKPPAEAIIHALIPDGNYQTFHLLLYNTHLEAARLHIRSGAYEKAMVAMQKARKHAEAYDGIQGEYFFTAPLFDRVRYSTDNWYLTGTTTMLDDFKALFDFPSYAPLQSHCDFAELIR